MDSRRMYQYQPLVEPGAIRLVVLQPDEDIEARLQCSMIHTTLAACNDDVIEHYSALSYVWGDARITTPIIVDGYYIDVTVNLDSALRHMRDPSRPRRVWADGVCINQNDGEEKSRQVSQMGDVYKLAKHTIIYLGDAPRETEDLLQNIRLQTLDIKIDNYADSHRAFLSLFNHPWFTRVWVFQELVMSLDPWIQCGTKRIRWDSMLKALNGLERINTQESPWKTVLSMDTARQTFHRGKGYDGSGFVGSLVNILDARRGLGVSDPRDMLFANIGVLGKAEGNLNQSYLVQVAYNKSHATVYTDVAKYVINMEGDLSILSFCEIAAWETDLGNPAGIPSWAPNWMLKCLPHPYRRLRECLTDMRWIKCFEDTGPHTLSSPDYSPLSTKFPVWIPPDIMACSGRILGKLSAVSPLITHRMAMFNMKHAVAKRKKSDTEIEPYELTPCYLLYEHWKHIIGPLLKVQPSLSTEELLERLSWEPRDNVCHWDGLLEKMYRLGALHSINPPIARCKDDLQELLFHLLLLFTSSPDEENACPQFLYGRRFAALEEGRLAVVPAKACEGDIVCFIDGDTFAPFILRPRDDVPQKEYIDRKIQGNFQAYNGTFCEIRHCDFVGECFVEDYMRWLSYCDFSYLLESAYVIFALH